eukprot:CAMPEP_0197475644 /NCGR_PEP_ID=MMETSP1309-20131121/7088_1 /TAXON_ID=464262 /ORGANISM="Genus nov. species nov., Strain RCC998" /LENGTH=311 /DNA_ID=CAMNT_0043015747 /DNA_START=21 /DNA_END=956 /DNA_ORIENTATION=-
MRKRSSRRTRRGHVSLSLALANAESQSQDESATASVYSQLSDDPDGVSSGVQIESSDHSPSEEDLRSICVMVSHQMKEQASAFRDVIHNGWPNIKTKGKTRKRKHEENPSEVLFGEQQASTSGKKKQIVTTFHMSGTPTPIYNFDRHDVESATDSETVREDLSSDEEEGTRGDSGIARQKNLQVVEEEGEDSVYSTPVLGVMDSLELLALMKGKPLKGEEGKKTRSEIKKIAASLLPRILLKLFIEMPTMPSHVSYNRRRPWCLKYMDSRLLNYQTLLSKIGKDLGIEEEVVARAFKKLRSKIKPIETSPL